MLAQPIEQVSAAVQVMPVMAGIATVTKMVSVGSGGGAVVPNVTAEYSVMVSGRTWVDSIAGVRELAAELTGWLAKELTAELIEVPAIEVIGAMGAVEVKANGVLAMVLVPLVLMVLVLFAP